MRVALILEQERKIELSHRNAFMENDIKLLANVNLMILNRVGWILFVKCSTDCAQGYKVIVFF